MTTSERIKEIRRAKGWTQAELANKLLVERNTVTRWEMKERTKNTRKPTDSHLLLAELLNYVPEQVWMLCLSRVTGKKINK